MKPENRNENGGFGDREQQDGWSKVGWAAIAWTETDWYILYGECVWMRHSSC